MGKKTPNPFCPVRGCGTTKLHTDDPTVAGLMQFFSPPQSLAYWSLAAMADLRNSIIADIESVRYFAWQTRLRQVEEIYFKALYCIFFASEKELPHIFSGESPNSIMPIYRKVNEVILEGRGQWEVSQSKQYSPQFTPLNILHSSAHASYSAIFTAISYARASEPPKFDRFIQHLDTYCDRLKYMHDMFNAGKDKQIVLDAMISMHRPLSYWQNLRVQST
jgi:hypothetical protein